MAACEEQGFSGITSEQFATFVEKAESMGIPGLKGQGNSGQASRSGVTIKWAFDPEAKSLKVQCTESPMLLPCGLINGKIREAVAYVINQTGAAGAPPEQQA